MFFDIAEITVTAGDGGDGAVSFRREKGIPKGGPNGGNGGHGGNVILVGTGSLRTLRPFQFKRIYKAQRGENGRGKDQYGKSGIDIEIAVPLGTVLLRKGEGDEKKRVGEVVEDGQRLVVAKGGRGGRGNAAFATPTQQVPYVAEKGVKGEAWELRLELRLIADVGIVGKPNAGKSTLLAAVTGARPKIAPYPFTTTEPQLGVVDTEGTTFVLAEIPGLLEGAHLGIGLGDEFLRHATRTRLLIHLVDGSAEDVSAAVREVDHELEAYGAGLPEKPQLLAVNKIDLPEVAERGDAIKRELEWTDRKIYFVSAAGRLGVEDLVRDASRLLATLPQPVEVEEPEAEVTPSRRRARPEIAKEGDSFVVLDERAVRLAQGSNLRQWAGRAQLKRQLDRLGVTEVLEEAGIKTGDTVRFGELELEW